MWINCASQVVCDVSGYGHNSERSELFYCVDIIERCKIENVEGDQCAEKASNSQEQVRRLEQTDWTCELIAFHIMWSVIMLE